MRRGTCETAAKPHPKRRRRRRRRRARRSASRAPAAPSRCRGRSRCSPRTGPRCRRASPATSSVGSPAPPRFWAVAGGACCLFAPFCYLTIEVVHGQAFPIRACIGTTDTANAGALSNQPSLAPNRRPPRPVQPGRLCRRRHPLCVLWAGGPVPADPLLFARAVRLPAVGAGKGGPFGVEAQGATRPCARAVALAAGAGSGAAACFESCGVCDPTV